MRWDMPDALSVESQLLFPTHLKTMVELINSDAVYNNLKLHIPETENIPTWQSDTSFSINLSNSLTYQTVQVQIPELYDSLVIPVYLQLFNDQTLVDELPRYVMIPAAPFSNEGLNVNIDLTGLDRDRNNIVTGSGCTILRCPIPGNAAGDLAVVGREDD